MVSYLALDTATDRPTLALGTPDDPGRDVSVARRQDLSRDIDRLVSALLNARGVNAGKLGGIVVADGPGSFTGLRIGVAFAKGLARALGIPLLAAPSLLGAAVARLPVSASARLVVAEYDALRGDVYRAVYRLKAGTIEVVTPPTLVPAGQRAPAGAVLAGAAEASAAALLALVGARNGPAPVADVATWEPDYGRPAEAEARRLARDAKR